MSIRRKGIAITLILVIILSIAVSSVSAEDDQGITRAVSAIPTKMWVESSADNNIPVQIDVFKKKTGGTNWNPTYTYQLYLPGNAVLENCFLSWDSDATATVNGNTYTLGNCPIPPADTQWTYSFRSGTQTTSFTVITYKGSVNVPAVFIDIDESLVTIAAMDSDPNHEITCSGRIFINGTEYVLSKMKGRGNATWKESDDKKPYNITLGKKINFPGIDSEKTKKWSLLAECLDRSLLGNRSGYHLAHELGIGQDTASADVWMNGEYQGCYTVTPKTDSFVTKTGFMIEQDNYKEDSVEEGGDPQFTLEGLKEASGWSSCYNRITVKKIGDDLLGTNDQGDVDESPERLRAVAEEIQSWLQDAWDAIRSDSGYNSKGKYYTDYIDIVSFAKMYLMHEYVKSYDVCAGSILFHRDGNTDDDKLIAGPLWDLDNAMGSVYQNSSLGKADDRRNGDRRSAEGDFIQNVTEYKTSIYKTISKHPDFMDEVEKQYNLNKAYFDSLADVTAQMISDVEDSAVMNHNKVNDLGNGTGKNNHYYSEKTTLGSGQYQQDYIATSVWQNYTDNLVTYISVRSLWFRNNYTHDLIHHDAQTATCTMPGWYAYDTCTRCSYTTYTEIPALGHELVYHDAQAATCTEAGWNAYDTCSRCEYTTRTEIPALGHNYAAAVTKPTCTDRGYTTHNCTRCNDSYVDTYTPAVGHNYAAVVTEPTCTDRGYTTHTCTRCSDSYVDSYISALGHELVHHDAQTATCTEAGWNAYDTCTRCEYTTYSKAPALGHDLVHHNAQAATCTENGWNAYDTCTRCGFSTYKTITAFGHNYNAVVTEPTCTDKGYTTHTCTRCSDSYVDSYTSALGHALEHHEAKAATCTETGCYAYDSCTRCGYTTYRAIPALNHDWQFVDFIWTGNDQDGYSAASAYYRCKNDETHTQTIEAALANTVTVQPTCTGSGVTTYTASYDGHSSSKKVAIAPHGHKFSNYFSNNDADFDHDGTKIASCEYGCGATDAKPDTGSMLVVKAISIASEPNVTTYELNEKLRLDGGKINVALTSGKTLSMDITEEMVSGFDSGRAGTCDVKVSFRGSSTSFRTTIVDNSYIRGDLNRDKKVTDADAVYLLMHTFFESDYPLDQSGDLNGDKKVSDADAVYLLMYTFFPEEYQLH